MDGTSALVRFQAGVAPDARGRMIADIWNWDDARLEAGHDYIQWLFPLPEPSAFNDDAPLLSDADIAAFAASVALREALARSFQRMLGFYGFALGAGPRIEPAPDFAAKAANWLCRHNHNYLRLSRILRALSLLGLRPEAVALLAALEAVYRRDGAQAIGQRALGFWRDAVTATAARPPGSPPIPRDR